MKKSEKIEIRLSPEEKRSVLRLAAIQGSSVSEFMRKLVRGENSVADKPSKRLAVYWMAAGVFAAAALAAFMVTTSMERGTYYVSGTVDDHAFGFSVAPKKAQPKRVVLSDNYFLAIDPLVNDQVRLTVCASENAKCNGIAVWRMEFDRRWPSVWQTLGPEEELISVSVQKLAS